MARGRMINQSISEDVEFNEMSIDAQLMFLRTVPFLDRDGLVNGNASVLRGKVAPLLELTKPMAAIVQEWISAGLVVQYTAGKQSVLFFPGFAKNQIGMRYDREAASAYPPPPGYTRTAKGLIAPGESGPQQPPNDDSDNGENSAEPDCEQTPDDCRTSAGLVPDELHANGIECNRIESNIREKGENTRERESAPKTNGVPPSSPNDYLPGLPDPRAKTSQRTRVVEYVMEAKKLGVDAPEFRLLVDALLDGFGKKPLADAGDERTLNYAQELALLIMGVSEQFRTPDGIAAIFKSWQANDWRGDSLPTSEQLKEHASLMASGKVTCTRKDKPPPPAKPTKLNYKSWLLRTYNADNPTFIGVSKDVLEKGYNDYVKQFQLQH